MISAVTFDHEVELIKEFSDEEVDTDDVGNQLEEPTTVKILCGKKSLTRNEFYKAASIGLKPSLVLIVNKYEYSDQMKLKFYDEIYQVVRSYGEPDSEFIELVCESDISDRK